MSPRNDVNAKYKRAHPAISERVPSQKIKLKNLLFLHHFWPLIILVQPLIPPDLNQVFWSYLLKCYGPWCTDKSPNFLLFILAVMTCRLSKSAALMSISRCAPAGDFTKRLCGRWRSLSLLSLSTVHPLHHGHLSAAVCPTPRGQGI